MSGPAPCAWSPKTETGGIVSVSGFSTTTNIEAVAVLYLAFIRMLPLALPRIRSPIRQELFRAAEARVRIAVWMRDRKEAAAGGFYLSANEFSMTASGDLALAATDSAPDSFHMCSPVGGGCWMLNRDSSVDRGTHRQGSLCSSSSSRSCLNLWLLVSILASLLLSVTQAQTLVEFAVDRTALNQQIQRAAFQSFPSRVRTGTVYNATLPGNLSSVVDVQMVRFRTGKLRRTGFQFQRVNLPVGVTVEGFPVHVVLVYRHFKGVNFHNISTVEEFVAPVVGIYVYNGSNLTTSAALPELNVTTSSRPIEVTASNLNIAQGTNVTCVLYNDTGLTAVYNITSTLSTDSRSCSFDTLGDFGLLVPRTMGSSDSDNDNAWKIAVGAVAGAIVLLGLLTLIALAAVKYREKSKFDKMERVADHGETLNHTLIAGGRAPAAASTRTKPVLENDYSS
ncbi:hypothetical protein R1sor_016180 [Riccia sorocarpa]|uniref:Transmembrane protein n=1 Tax=Riccia sorocarpa TaxID=122646 RepID=A0ABD3HG97_9MARC